MHSKGPRSSVTSRIANVGLFPYIVQPVLNYRTYILYVNILLPCRSFSNRAWLREPLAAGERAVVRLESTLMNLGQDGEAPRVVVQTPVSGTRSSVPNGAPLLLGMESVSGSFVFGGSEDEFGYLTASVPPTTIPTTANPSSLEVFTCGSRTVLTGRKSEARSGDRRELRAIRIPVYEDTDFETTADADGVDDGDETRRRRRRRRHRERERYPVWRENGCCGYQNGYTDVAYYHNSEYYLAWREPASNEGFPVTLTFVSEDTCWPCPTRFVGSPCCPRPVYYPDADQQDENTVVAGPAWGFR
jgi:hypothetical protein